MASEIRVNKINSQTGVGTITLSPTGVDISGITTVSTLKVGTGVTASEDGDIFFTGVCTATTFAGAHSGSGANLTSLPAAQLTGSLPAISALNLTNVPAANVVGVHTSLNITGSTTTGTAVVGGGVTISESGIEASGIGITVANINGGAISGRRNLVINGSMKIAQRGTSYTGTNAYHTVDRFRTFYGTQNENQTYTQGTLSSSDSPYTEGQRHYFRVQNGNQTSGAQAGSYVIIQNRIEAQDVANSGWNYTDPNSSITLQFWLRASVSQDYMITVESSDGTNKAYVFLVSLTANTWTKVIRTLPGHADLTFNNDTGIGLKLGWYPYIGTTYSGSSTTLNDWVTMTNPYRRTMTTTWFTTNDSTFDIAGVQLEVGTQATPFEHRSFGDEHALCQRYYCHTYSYGTYPGENFNDSGSLARQGMVFGYRQRDNNYQAFFWSMPTAMRAVPTQTMYSMVGTAGKASGSQTDYTVNTNSPHNGSSGVMAYGTNPHADDGYVHFVLDAEL